MKALILSDIHSNLPALEAIWRQECDSDAVFCAGDLVDYGPFPCEVLDWVRQRGVRCVKGNHDLNVVQCRRGETPMSGLPIAERAWRHHNAELLREEDLGFLDMLPLTLGFTLDGIGYGMTHAYRGYATIEERHDFESFRHERFGAAGGGMTRLVFGHTHVPDLRRFGDAGMWLNPGSASYSRGADRDREAHYIVITDGAIELRRTAYDLGPMRRCLDQVRLMDAEMAVVRRAFGAD